MEIAGLALAIPPTIGGILKCIKLFKEISDKFQGADDRVQRIMAVCRMLEMALLQLEPAGADRPDGPLSLMPANCAKIITSMETLLRKLGVDPGDATTVTDLKRIEYVWKDDEVASLTKLMDQCRDDIQFYLVLQLHHSQGSKRLEPSKLQKKAARHSSIIQSDADTLRFSFLSNNSEFSTTALNINPDRASLASVQFSFDQAIQSSRVYKKFATAALPSLPPGATAEDDDAQMMQGVEAPDDDSDTHTVQGVGVFEDVTMDGDIEISDRSLLLGTVAEQPRPDPARASPEGWPLPSGYSDRQNPPVGEASGDHSPLLRGSVIRKQAPAKKPTPTRVKDTMFVEALYDYDNADDRTSLSFVEGDRIQVLDQLESGWWDGVLDGVRGWFPSNYCRVVVSTETKESEISMLFAAMDDILEGEEEGEESEVVGEGLDFWIPQATIDGRLYYYNILTGESRISLF